MHHHPSQCSGTIAGRLLPQRSRRRFVHRGELLLLLGAALYSALLVPESASAACGVTDPGACTDAVQYNLWHGFAAMLWMMHRALLSLAYQIDNFRWWLVETVFTTVFSALSAVISPVLDEVALVAITVGCFLFLVTPVFGRVEVVNIRRALVWICIAPALLAVSGTWLAESERFRTQVGAALFAAVAGGDDSAQSTLATLFGVSASDMPKATELYGANGARCASALARKGVTGIQIDDMAAALLYANAQDIHCPEFASPGDDLPDGFYQAPSPQYATAESIDILDAALRQARIRGIQKGVARLSMGLFPSILAVLAKLVDLIFSFALMLLWLSLPIGLMFVFFLDTAGGVTKLFRRLAGVLQASWMTSLMLGVLFFALTATATLGNAASYSGLSVLGIFLCVYALKLAVEVLMSSFTAVSQTVAMATGSSDRLFGQSIASTAVGLATGGAGAAVASTLMARNYNVARREGASRRYAVGTALGRSKLLSGIGDAAASLGYQTDLTDGLYTGRRSRLARDRWRVVRDQTAADAKQVYGDDDLPMGERQKRQRITRALAGAERGNIVNQALHGVRVGAEGGVRGTFAMASSTVQAVRALQDDPRAATTTAGRAVVRGSRALVQPAKGFAARRVRNAAWTVQTRAQSRGGAMRWPRATVQAIASGLRPELESARMRYDQGRLRTRPRYAPNELPGDAQQAPRSELERLLLDGKTVQFEGPDTLWYWDRQWQQRRSTAGSPAAAQPRPASSRRPHPTPTSSSPRSSTWRPGRRHASGRRTASSPGARPNSQRTSTTRPRPAGSSKRRRLPKKP